MKDARAKNSRTRHKIIALQIGSSAALSLNGIALCDCNFWGFFLCICTHCLKKTSSICGLPAG